MMYKEKVNGIEYVDSAAAEVTYMDALKMDESEKIQDVSISAEIGCL